VLKTKLAFVVLNDARRCLNQAVLHTARRLSLLRRGEKLLRCRAKGEGSGSRVSHHPATLSHSNDGNKMLLVLAREVRLFRSQGTRSGTQDPMTEARIHNFLTPAVDDILKESRKYRLYLTLTQQTIGDKMGPELFNSVMTNTEVKITGFNDKKCLDLMASKTHTAPERLYRLGLGRFAVKVGKGIWPATFILRTPRFLLGNANAMSPAEWEALKEQQLKAYYKPAKTWAERPLVEPEAGTDPVEFTPLPGPGAPAVPQSGSGRPAGRGPKYPF
jgi:hypothetical protein